MWGDIPHESYQRVSRFLFPEEKKLYLDVEYCAEGVIDAWWYGDKENVNKFISVVKLTEERFLKQQGLISKIEKSKEIAEMVDYALSVHQAIKEGIVDGEECNFTPKTKVDGIPTTWFEAAERVIKNKNGILNFNTVKLLAVDAWQQTLLKNDFTGVDI